jgi:hypothetical protein
MAHKIHKYLIKKQPLIVLIDNINYKIRRLFSGRELINLIEMKIQENKFYFLLKSK